MIGGCSPRYTVALQPIPPQEIAAPIPIEVTVSLPPETANYVYNVRSLLAGYANIWEIHVGEAIANYSKAFFAHAFKPGSDVVVQIDIEKFDVRDFEARCDLRFTVRRGDHDLFQKTYQGGGLGYAARVVWGGAFAMKSSMRKTTDEALRSIFTQFLNDAKARKDEWLS